MTSAEGANMENAPAKRALAALDSSAPDTSSHQREPIM
jgi:hypothetical protein